MIIFIKTLTGMENFTNSVILPEDLPQIEKTTFNGLHKKYLHILFIRLILFYIVMIAGFITFVLLNREIPNYVLVIISAVIALSLVYSVIITMIGFPRKGYLVRENDISFKRGVITYKQTSVPFNRIQHVEVNQGVLAKIFKLSSVKIFTAGGNTSDLSVPGLPEEIAKNLKAFLSEKISEHE